MIKHVLCTIQTFFKKLCGTFSCSKNNAQARGVIKFFDKKKKFGFIVADGKDYFFNATASNNANFNALKDGVAVKFDIIQGKKGLQAKNVELA